jgi:hypothetical protein
MPLLTHDNLEDLGRRTRRYRYGVESPPTTSDELQAMRRTQGNRSVWLMVFGPAESYRVKFAMGLATKGKVPPPFPPHVAAEVQESRALFDLVKTQGRDGAAGIVQGETALGRIDSHHTAASGRDPYSEEDSAPRPFLPSEREEAEGVTP